MNQFLANHLDAIISAIIGLIAGGISVRLLKRKIATILRLNSQIFQQEEMLQDVI